MRALITMKDALTVFEEERCIYNLMYFDGFQKPDEYPKRKRGRPKQLQKRKSRLPSEYNRFVKEKMQEFKNHFSNKDCMRLCAELWQLQKQSP